MSLRAALQYRERKPELMDDPRLAAPEHVRALNALARINRVSGTVGTLWKAIRPLILRLSSQRLRVLDVGCGAGDVAVGLWQRSARCDRHLDIAACDISPVAIDDARRRAESAGAHVRFFQHDAMTPTPDDFDIVYSTLFLHHLGEKDAVRLLSSMRSRARRMVLVSDLVRSRVGYALTWCGVRMLTRSLIVHTDGPLSVRASFTEHEVLTLAHRAGLTPATIARHWPRRFLLRWDTP